MKTRLPLIVTAHVAAEDIAAFDLLRQAHFPPGRNFLSAHLTMFHRLPGEYGERILSQLRSVADGTETIAAEVGGLRHLGAGVAYGIDSPALHAVRDRLKGHFAPWLGPQDQQAWKPHITLQNKVSREAADRLFRQLSEGFTPWRIGITGVDLWRYLDGPWAHVGFLPFGDHR